MHLNSTNTFHKMEIENEATGTHLKIIVFLNRISHITTCITLADYYHIPTEHRLHHRVAEFLYHEWICPVKVSTPLLLVQ